MWARLSLSRWPRYHYYGIAVKESSQYYDVMYSKKGAAWVSETGKREVTKQTVAYSPRSKLGTLLPDFPNVKDLNLPASLPEEKVTSFEEIAGGEGGVIVSLSLSLLSLSLFLSLSLCLPPPLFLIDFREFIATKCLRWFLQKHLYKQYTGFYFFSVS
jgi:hypothetical protein